MPRAPLYLLCDLDRGDAMADWTPDDALPAIADAGRTPLMLTEGVQWLVQCPDVLERGHCFMTIGSRLRKPSGVLDARTPAVWISNGTGRDGSANREAPKVGSALGRQPAHLARLRFSGRQARHRGMRSGRTPCAASTNGRTVSSQAVGADENTKCPVGNGSNVDPGMASETALPQRNGAVGSLAPQVVSTGALIREARPRRSCPTSDHGGPLGLEGLSVNAVVAAAGVSKGTFFHHFPDRVSYLVAVDRRFHDVLFEEVATAIGDLKPGKDRLGVAARTYLDACLRDCGVKALLLEARGHLPIADEVTRRNRMNVDVFAVDFTALGWPHPCEAARLWGAATAECALIELERGRRNSAARTTLDDLVGRARG